MHYNCIDEQMFHEIFNDDFLAGQLACKAGAVHEHKSAAYDRGYNTQYNHEQRTGNEKPYTMGCAGD